MRAALVEIAGGGDEVIGVQNQIRKGGEVPPDLIKLPLGSNAGEEFLANWAHDTGAALHDQRLQLINRPISRPGIAPQRGGPNGRID